MNTATFAPGEDQVGGVPDSRQWTRVDAVPEPSGVDDAPYGHLRPGVAAAVCLH
jgi:hypothetical protein